MIEKAICIVQTGLGGKYKENKTPRFGTLASAMAGIGNRILKWKLDFENVVLLHRTQTMVNTNYTTTHLYKNVEMVDTKI